MKRCKKAKIIVENIVSGAPAAQCGICNGDQLLSINGIRPRDIIDYRFLCAAEKVNLRIRRLNGQVVTYKINKDYDNDLGMAFSKDCFDGVKHCRNNCVFCFVDQLPGHLRSSLYEKDDDYRLSFLHGNYITLTNLQASEINRVINLKMSPLYISVHATDPELRGRMLGLKAPAPVLDLISQFAQAGIVMHVQVVFCPDWNDGALLERTIGDLSVFWPQVASVGVVPVGLTKFRGGIRHLPSLRSITSAESKKLIMKLCRYQKSFRKRNGVSFVYLADEFFLKAGIPFPPYEEYDGFPQLENGIGQGRLFYEDFRKLRPLLPNKVHRRCPLFIATSRDGGRVLLPVVRRLRMISNLNLKMISIPSIFFGPRITVTGLLTGQDLLWGLRNTRGEDVLLPRILLRRGTSLFLDGLSVAEVEYKSGCTIHLLDPTAASLVEHICMLGGVR